MRKLEQIALTTPETLGDYLRIAAHPALRIGFLDAQSGKPFMYDGVLDRCRRETPRTASQIYLLGIDLEAGDEAEAQRRYEEGRLLVKQFGLRCRSWNHPDYPPRSVVGFILDRLMEKGAGNAET